MNINSTLLIISNNVLMLVLNNTTISEENVKKIIIMFNNTIPKGCKQIEIYKKWNYGLIIKKNEYIHGSTDKISIWSENSSKLFVEDFSYSDIMILYVSMQSILGKEYVSYI